MRPATSTSRSRRCRRCRRRRRLRLDHCYNPDAVWTTYMTDGSPGLVRRHTLDAYTAMADPGGLAEFRSRAASRGTRSATPRRPRRAPTRIVQKEVSPQNLAMFSNGTGAFIGDYIDSAGQLIVATGDVAQPYKFNAGRHHERCVRHRRLRARVSRRVHRQPRRDTPSAGIGRTPACQTTDFTKDANGNITGVKVGTTWRPRLRRQSQPERLYGRHRRELRRVRRRELEAAGFECRAQLRRHGAQPERHRALVRAHAARAARGREGGVQDSRAGLRSTVTPVFVFVQPKSSAARVVWAKSGTGNAKVTVQVQSLAGPPNHPAERSANVHDGQHVH